MFWSSVFLIFRRKNRWKIIFDGSYGKLFSRSFSFYFSADFSIHSFLNNSWGNFVYKRNQGVECHGNHRTQLHQMVSHATYRSWPCFLVACYATLHPALSVRRSVRRSVRWSVRRSVRWSHFTFLGSLGFLAVTICRHPFK